MSTFKIDQDAIDDMHFWRKVVDKTELCKKGGGTEDVSPSLFSSNCGFCIKDCYWEAHKYCWKKYGKEL